MKTSVRFKKKFVFFSKLLIIVKQMVVFLLNIYKIGKYFMKSKASSVNFHLR